MDMPTRSAVKSGEASRSDASSSDDGALGAIIDDVVGRYRQGEVIDVEQIVADYPGLASELRQVLPIVLALEAPPGAPQPTSGGHASPFGNLLHGRLLGDFRIGRELGEEHPRTLSAMVRLQGQTYYEQQRYADAEAVLAEALEGRRKALGDEHRHTLRTKDHLARVYLGQQRYADSERLLRERLAVDEESPSDH